MEQIIDLDRQTTRDWLLRYRDAKGVISERVVFPLSLIGEFDGTHFGVSTVDARCAKARAKRSFRCDRMIEVGDLQSGEMISADAWIKALDFDSASHARAITLHRQYAIMLDRQEQQAAEMQLAIAHRRRRSTVWKIAIFVGTLAALAWFFLPVF